MARPLGENQLVVLRVLKSHGEYPGRWVLNNHSQTVRVLESLVKRGLVEKADAEYGGTYYKIATEEDHD